MVVYIVGYGGSGKSVVASALASMYMPKRSFVDVSSVIKQITRECGVSIGKDLKNNEEVFDALFDMIDETTIVVGIRESYLLEKFNEVQPNEGVFYLDVSEKTRFQRILHTRDISLNDVLTKDLVERQIGLPELLYNGKHKINTVDCNIRTVAEIATNIFNTLEKVRK